MEHSLPLQSKDRIFIIDAIRGVALCGILILNVYYFARPASAEHNLLVYAEESTPNIVTWYITNFIAEGSYRALFSMLFGAGVILLVSRLERHDHGLGPADVYYKRLIWLLIFGLINQYVILWSGDILYTYSICGLFLFPLRKASIRLLLILSVFFICVTMWKQWSHDVQAIEKPTPDKEKIENIRKEADKELVEMKESYPKIWAHLLTWNQKFESTIFYHELFFDGMIFMLFGMALFKADVLTGDRPLWWYVLFVVLGYTWGIGYGIWQGNLWYQAHYTPSEYYRIRPMSIRFYQLHRIGVSLGHLGLIILLWKSNLFNWLLKLFANVGQMAFSNYLGQSLIGTFFFYGYGLNYFGRLARYELWYFVVAVWIFQIAFSAIWLHYFRFGPLEWVWRSLTYWKIQPLKKD